MISAAAAVVVAAAAVALGFGDVGLVVDLAAVDRRSALQPFPLCSPCPVLHCPPPTFFAFDVFVSVFPLLLSPFPLLRLLTCSFSPLSLLSLGSTNNGFLR